MAIASPLRKVASQLMAKFGGSVSVRRIAIGLYNPTAGTVSQTFTDTNIKGVLEDVSRNEIGDLIQAGDKRLIIAAADILFVPTPADQIVIGARILQILQVRTIEQDNTAITYELILRD